MYRITWTYKDGSLSGAGEFILSRRTANNRARSLNVQHPGIVHTVECVDKQI